MPLSPESSDNFKTRYPDHVYPFAGIAVDFLLEIANHGPMTIVTVPVGGSGPRCQTYDTSNLVAVEAMRSFIAFHETQPSQVFYLPGIANEKTIGVPNRGAMEWARSIVLDFDPDKELPLPEERDRLRGVAHRLIIGPLQPRAVIDTGGGMQVVYQLLEPVPVTPDSILELEALMKALSRSLGADTATCTIKNLFRVPGTFNWPTAAKKKAGRERSVSGVWFSGGPRTSLVELRALATVLPEDIQVIEGDIPFDCSEHDLLAVLDDPAALPGRVVDAIRKEPGIQKAIVKPSPASGDRSGDDHQLCCTLAHFSIAPGDMALILAAYGAKVVENHSRGNLLGYCVHTVKRALRDAAPGRLFDDLRSEAEKLNDIERHRAHVERLKPLTFTEAISGLFELDSNALVQGFMGQREITVIYGQSGSGKTFIGLDLGFRISKAMPWNERVTTRKAVVYIAAESPKSIRYRMKALADIHGVSDAFFLIASSVNLFDARADLQLLIDNIAALGVDVGVIVIDTLARVMLGGNENSTQDMSRLVANGDILRDRFGANVVWIHHSGKNQTLGARGSSALVAATDTEIEITDREAGHELRVTKMRDGDPFSYRFRLRQVVVGTMVDGAQRTSCVVEWEHGAGPLGVDTPGSSVVRWAMDILRKEGRYMTLDELIIHGELTGTKPKLKKNSIIAALNRSCGSETERFIVKQISKRNDNSREIPEYGLVNW